MFHIFYITIFYIFIELVSGLKRPSYITACYRDDLELNACGLRSGNRAIPEIAKGDPIYKIPNMKPMHIPGINVSTGNNLKLAMKNIVVSGLDEAILEDVNFDLDARNIVFYLYIRKFEVIGDYSIDGRILVMPIVGEGIANITYVEGHYVYPVHFELVKRKNVEYMQLVGHNLTFTLKRAYYQFDNLFNGNELLGKQIKTFLVEHWQDVNKDVGPLIGQAIDTIATSIANAILGKVPYDDVFLKRNK